MCHDDGRYLPSPLVRQIMPAAERHAILGFALDIFPHELVASSPEIFFPKIKAKISPPRHPAGQRPRTLRAVGAGPTGSADTAINETIRLAAPRPLALRLTGDHRAFRQLGKGASGSLPWKRAAAAGVSSSVARRDGRWRSGIGSGPSAQVHIAAGRFSAATGRRGGLIPVSPATWAGGDHRPPHRADFLEAEPAVERGRRQIRSAPDPAEWWCQRRGFAAGEREPIVPGV